MKYVFNTFAMFLSSLLFLISLLSEFSPHFFVLWVLLLKDPLYYSASAFLIIDFKLFSYILVDSFVFFCLIEYVFLV